MKDVQRKLDLSLEAGRFQIQEAKVGVSPLPMEKFVRQLAMAYHLVN